MITTRFFVAQRHPECPDDVQYFFVDVPAGHEESSWLFQKIEAAVKKANSEISSTWEDGPIVLMLWAPNLIKALENEPAHITLAVL